MVLAAADVVLGQGDQLVQVVFEHGTPDRLLVDDQDRVAEHGPPYRRLPALERSAGHVDEELDELAHDRASSPARTESQAAASDISRRRSARERASCSRRA